MIVVTAAVIIRGDKILITQRKSLKWEFPGGKVEEGEHPEDALRRELREELAVNVDVGDIFTVVSHKYSDRHVLLLCYRCELISDEIKPLECRDYEWVQPKDLWKYDFLEADLPIVKKLQRGRY